MQDDLSALEKMVYSGRGIIVGMNPNEDVIVGYSLTGRSSSSQARKLIEGAQTKTIRTEVTDREQLEEGSPALLLYPAIVPIGDAIIASNGAQIKLIYTTIMNTPNAKHPQLILSHSFEKPFYEYDQKDDRWIDITTYEPDSNNTSRISACVIGNEAAMHIVRNNEGKKESEIHVLNLEPSKGYLMTTYKGGNEKPLLPFTGKPLEITINSIDSQDFVESIYNAIKGGQGPSDNYRVSSAVMLRITSGIFEYSIINRFDRGN